MINFYCYNYNIVEKICLLIMADYKGIYYHDNSKQEVYEGGAHFDYYKLYKILEKLSLEQKMRMKRNKLVESREKKNKQKNNKSTEKIEKNKNIVS